MYLLTFLVACALFRSSIRQTVTLLGHISLTIVPCYLYQSDAEVHLFSYFLRVHSQSRQVKQCAVVVEVVVVVAVIHFVIFCKRYLCECHV